VKCLRCGTENAEDSSFCRACGARLVTACPQCGSECRPGDKFCSKCGTRLSAPSEPAVKTFTTDEKLELIKRYLPKALAEKILSQRDRIEGERKLVTVLFCDMVGYTSLSEILGPEDSYSIIDRVYEILIHKVHEFEGTINDMSGDGILALFGAPLALEDAPQRAVRSGFAIHREIHKYNDSIRLQYGNAVSIMMRIGIHTGPVVVGTVGNDLRVDFKAIGDTVNTASRIEGLAEPGTSYVSEDTFKLTEGLFRFEALGEREVKGKKKPVRVYRVIAPSSRKTRFDMSAERGLTPFLGRERELELLIDGFERVKGGRGQAFSIMADAGVGKSRLLYEFRKAVANEDATFIEGKCLSYSRGVPYHPVTDILKANFEVSGNDGDPVKRKKVEEGLKALSIDEVSALPYLLELLSVKDSGIDRIPLSPETKRVRIREAVRHIVLRGSELRPLILAIEDLHWGDESSEELFRDLMDSISGSRVMLLFTYRPEFVHTWGGRSYHSQVNLNRLSNRESLLMVSNLLGTHEIAEEVSQFILERTEGVPFFIEEFVRSLKDLKVLEKKGKSYTTAKDLRDISIPSTIQDVIMARIDSLPETAKKLLQTGSVIGREFSHELIKEVAELPEEDLLGQLSILKEAELLFERGIYPHSTYIFKHALTQDASSGSLLKSTRRKYHERVARVLEDHFPGTAEAQPERLGHHFTEAGLCERAIPYWRRAGEIAVKRSAHKEGTGFFKRGIELTKKMADTPERAQIELDLQNSLGQTLMINEGFYSPEGKRALDRARELCRQVGETSKLFTVLHALWIFYLAHGERQTAFELAKQCLELAENLENTPFLVEAHHAFGSTHYWCGEYESALSHLERGSDLYDSLPSGSQVLPPGREDPGVVHKSHCAHTLWILGYPDRALDKVQAALALGEELDHPFSLVFAQLCAAMVNLYRGELEQAREQAGKAVETSEKREFGLWLIWAKVYLGATLAALGQAEEGIEHTRRGVELSSMAGILGGLPSWKTLLAEACGIHGGRVEEGLAVLDEAQRNMDDTGFRMWEEELHRIRGELLLMRDKTNMSGAESSFRKAIDTARQRKAKSLELRASMALSRLWHKQGKKDEAEKLLSEIYGWFTEGFDTGDLRTAKKLLEEYN